MSNEQIIDLIKPLKGIVFEKYNRNITIDFEIIIEGTNVVIDISDKVKDWFSVYWELLHEGHIGKVKEKIKEDKGWCYVTVSQYYSDPSWKKAVGAKIIILN